MDNNLSYADFAAMANNGNGANAMWNNPFMYLIWLAWFGGGNGFGFGGNRAGVAAGDVQAANNAAAIQNLSDMIQDNHNSDLTMQAINGNTAAITQLANLLNVSTDNITAAINVMSSNMQNGMCGIKTEILSQGYQNQLSTCQQTNTILQQSQALTNTVQNGFTMIGHQIQMMGCDIEKNDLANTQKILDTLNNHWGQEQQGIINSLQSQLSEQRILNAVNASKTTPTT
jgi:hypothetical protein